MKELLVLFLVASLLGGERAENIPACDNGLYCEGELLESVQLAAVFDDSKEYVDLPCLNSPDVVLELFNQVNRSDASAVRAFVGDHFSCAGCDLLEWEPADWTEVPSFALNITDEDLRNWALDINALWREFGRKPSSDVYDSPYQHSIEPTPHPFIVPGGRFREFYYWDSYWIMRGLLLGGMTRTAEMMVFNLVFLVERYGLVPNGGRQYYSRRSQPPLLTQMVDLLFSFTQNTTFLSSVLPSLRSEYNFWMSQRTIVVGGATVNRYSANLSDPRPESYREDMSNAFDQVDQPAFFSELASGAESGWDFSSRWLSPDSNDLSSIRTRSIVPVDLNAILCQNEATLARLYRIVGNNSEAEWFDEALQRRQQTFDSLFWNESAGLWRDWDTENNRHLEGFYASSLVPLLWGCTPTNLTRHKVVLSKINASGLLSYPGGIPTSLNQESGQQWDFPNAWAPLQWFPVVAWYNSSVTELEQAARSIALTWLNTTYTGWVNYNGTMFEKYNCTTVGQPGEGGEYTVQSGFGWTNGVVLHFLSLYPDAVLTPNNPLPPSSSRSALGWITLPLLVVLITVVTVPCVYWCRWMFLTGERRYWARVRNEHLLATSGGRSSSPTVYTNRYVNTDGDSLDGRELFTWDA